MPAAIDAARALGLLILLCGGAAAADVAILTDANFEHTTQASTGQTTGKWLVCLSDDSACSEVPDVWQALGAATKRPPLMDAGANLATVHLGTNSQLAKRFGAKPRLLLLADRSLFTVEAGDSAHSVESLSALLGGAYADTLAQPVPAPAFWLEALLRGAPPMAGAVESLEGVLAQLGAPEAVTQHSGCVLLLAAACVLLLVYLLIAPGSSAGGSGKKGRRKKAE